MVRLLIHPVQKVSCIQCDISMHENDIFMQENENIAPWVISFCTRKFQGKIGLHTSSCIEFSSTKLKKLNFMHGNFIFMHETFRAGGNQFMLGIRDIMGILTLPKCTGKAFYGVNIRPARVSAIEPTIPTKWSAMPFLPHGIGQ